MLCIFLSYSCIISCRPQEKVAQQDADFNPQRTTGVHHVNSADFEQQQRQEQTQQQHQEYDQYDQGTRVQGEEEYQPINEYDTAETPAPVVNQFAVANNDYDYQHAPVEQTKPEYVDYSAGSEVGTDGADYDNQRHQFDTASQFDHASQFNANSQFDNQSQFNQDRQNTY